MGSWPTLEEQIEAAGIHYPRSYDVTYRIGYVLQSIGAMFFFLFYLLKGNLFLIPLLLFEAGIVLSALFLLVWKREIKRFILIITFLGIFTQLLSLFAGSLKATTFLLGLGFILVGGAGLVGKEAYCFGFIEGWLLLFAYPVAIIPNVFGFSNHNFNLFLSAIIAALHLSFLRKKLSQPLLKSCKGVCGLPEGMKEG